MDRQTERQRDTRYHSAATAHLNGSLVLSFSCSVYPIEPPFIGRCDWYFSYCQLFRSINNPPFPIVVKLNFGKNTQTNRRRSRRKNRSSLFTQDGRQCLRTKLVTQQPTLELSTPSIATYHLPRRRRQQRQDTTLLLLCVNLRFSWELNHWQTQLSRPW